MTPGGRCARTPSARPGQAPGRPARMTGADGAPPPAPEVLPRLQRYTFLASVTHGTQVSRPFLVHGIAARELHADHHHPDRVPTLQAAIDRTARRRPITSALAA